MSKLKFIIVLIVSVVITKLNHDLNVFLLIGLSLLYYLMLVNDFVRMLISLTFIWIYLTPIVSVLLCIWWLNGMLSDKPIFVINSITKEYLERELKEKEIFDRKYESLPYVFS